MVNTLSAWQASAPTQAMADEYCEKWVQKLRTRFGDACYGFEDTTLAQAALDALLKKRRLLVAADEATGRLLGNACAACSTAKQRSILATRPT